MNKDDISQLKKRIDERTENFQAALASNAHKNPDESLATLADTDGWGIVRAAFDAMISELLEPESFEGSPEAYAISGESRRLTIQALRSVIATVDAAKASRVSQKTTEGVSE